MKRLRDIVAPVRPAGQPKGYRRLLRWAALPVTDRRWAAPLCAAALGFGLFAGVAIGPGTSGSLAIGTPQVIEIPSLLTGGGGGGEEAEGEGEVEGGGLTEPSGGLGGESSPFEAESSSSEFIPSFEEEESPEPSGSGEPSPSGKEKESAKEEAEPEEEAQPVSGVVVHVNPAAGSYTLVESGGLLSAVHTAKPPAPGAQVSVPVRTLANGTFAEAGARKQKGKKMRTSFQGIVTFVDPDPATPAYAVSKRGASVLVQVRPDPTGAPAQLPQLGAYATVAVEIEKTAPAATPPATEALPPVATAPPAETPPVSPTPPAATCAPDPAVAPPAIPAPVAVLWQQELDADGAPFASSDFEGVVMAVCPEQGTLLLSADDLRESGNDLLFTVPKSIDTSKLEAGDSVATTAAIEAGGTLTLTGLASDERTKGADDAATAQGDLVSHQPK